MTTEQLNDLVCQHIPLANKLAAYAKDREEARAVAYLALVQVSRRYRPEVGSFGAFAKPRVRGAIQDYFRGVKQTSCYCE